MTKECYAILVNKKKIRNIAAETSLNFKNAIMAVSLSVASIK